jgi:hypothetical protein
MGEHPSKVIETLELTDGWPKNKPSSLENEPEASCGPSGDGSGELVGPCPCTVWLMFASWCVAPRSGTCPSGGYMAGDVRGDEAKRGRGERSHVDTCCTVQVDLLERFSCIYPLPNRNLTVFELYSEFSNSKHASTLPRLWTAGVFPHSYMNL